MRKIFSIFSAFILVNIIRVVSPFLLLPLLTHALTPSDYGILSLYDASVLVLVPLVLFNSPGLVGARFYKTSKGYIAEVNTAALFLTVLCCCILFFFLLCFSAAELFYNSFGGEFILLLPVFVLARAINTYLAGLLQTQHKVRMFGVFSIGTLFLDLGLSLIFVSFFSMGYKGRLIASSFAFLIFSFYGICLMRRDQLLSPFLMRERIVDIFEFGLPLIPHALGGVSLAVSSRYLIAYMLGQGAAGVYAVGYQVGSIMLLVGTSINQAWSVSLFKWLGEGIEKSRSMIRKVMMGLFFLLLTSLAMLWFCRDFVFWLLSNHHFEDAKLLYPYMLIGFFFQSLYFLIVNFDFYEEKVKSIGITTFFTSILSLLLCYVLVKQYGLIGAGYSYAISMFFYFAVVLIRVVGFNMKFRGVWLRNGK
ncbi:lipopolysaccharide biosynthesis protein [Chromobacterium violaceum]|uniref:Polysaccharide biosynthesis protein C-terminal domain-containing protein n=2 Tax=Chromobacterium violaceum TaxID=536 RepID=A0A202B555_CHRVL|nr:oligosaccharide flippase family protein [Chromobacterium violaceum]AAQ61687.1 probable lipopolysaccharide biosynthesis protein [Chromobacterium violaceum ATCC 12472]MBA8736603.1 oligosaccharide flippase family protein [Chromobacterium violaceum]OVE46532.1 hypothetical protein CBW21_17965 [Chromobacterium violaceum]SUX89130.1 Polysaccharide biosynthesis protein [Chromobacterium violaceum]